MKRNILFFGLLFAAECVSAESVTSALVSFYTTGPDTYADSTPVRVGETYLLVHAAAGAAFGGVNTDGTLANTASNRIAARAAAVKGGNGAVKCPLSYFEHPLEGEFAGGAWYTVLLDTRNAGAVSGLVSRVAQVATRTDSFFFVSVGAAAAAGGAAGFDDRLATSSLAVAPVIAGVRMDAGAVALTVRNLSVGIYKVQGASAPDAAWTDTGYGFQNADASVTTQDVILPAEAVGDFRFFRVFAR